MPPKVTENRPSPEALHAVEEKTARAARRIVATYSEDFLDGVTLMCMLGVEPEGLLYKKVAAEHEETSSPKKVAKRTRKAPAAVKKTTKKAPAKKAPAKKTTKKS